MEALNQSENNSTEDEEVIDCISELIRAVLDKAKETLKEDLKVAKEASVIFDGTARLGKALAIVVRYVQQDLKPTQRLIPLEVLAKALRESSWLKG